jgi:hypothetical protein
MRSDHREEVKKENERKPGTLKEENRCHRSSAKSKLRSQKVKIKIAYARRAQARTSCARESERIAVEYTKVGASQQPPTRKVCCGRTVPASA